MIGVMKMNNGNNKFLIDNNDGKIEIMWNSFSRLRNHFTVTIISCHPSLDFLLGVVLYFN